MDLDFWIVSEGKINLHLITEEIWYFKSEKGGKTELVVKWLPQNSVVNFLSIIIFSINHWVHIHQYFYNTHDTFSIGYK